MKWTYWSSTNIHLHYLTNQKRKTIHIHNLANGLLLTGEWNGEDIAGCSASRRSGWRRAETDSSEQISSGVSQEHLCELLWDGCGFLLVLFFFLNPLKYSGRTTTAFQTRGGPSGPVQWPVLSHLTRLILKYTTAADVAVFYSFSPKKGTRVNFSKTVVLILIY